MAGNPFPEWLVEVASDSVVVRPSDIDAEARGNMWSFALSPEQAAVVSIADVEVFAASVVDSRRAWLRTRRAGSMVLYWWHEKQAGQLRFSLVSATHDRLPFACETVPTASLAEVVAEWLRSPHLHGLPWAELRPLVPGEEVPEPTQGLPVWSLLVP